MYTTSQDFKNIIDSKEQQYDAYIVLENNTTINKDISNFKIISTLGDKLIGNVGSKRLEFTLFNADKYNIANKEFDVYVGLYIIENTIEYVPFGRFIADKPVENNEGTNEVNVIANDYSSKFKKEYSSNLGFPCTILQSIQEQCNNLGLELESNIFINSDYIIKNKFFVESGSSYKPVTGQHAEVCASNLIINRDNKVKFKELPKQNEYVKTINMQKTFECKKDDNFYGYVNSVVSSRVQADDGSTTEDVFEKNEDSIAEHGLFEYKIVENWIIDDDRESALPKILNSMLNFNFWPTKLEIILDPSLDVGDLLRIYDSVKDKYYITLIKTIEYDVTNGVCYIESTMPTITETDYASATLSKKILRTEFKVNKQQGVITSVVEQTDDHASQLAQQQLTLNEISQQVESITEISRTANGKNVLILENAGNINLLGLNLKAKTQTKNYAGLSYSGLNYPTSSKASITLVIDKNTRGNVSEEAIVKHYEVDLLNNLDDVHDELVVEFNTENNKNTVKLVRRIINEYGGYVVATNPQISILESDIDLTLFDGTNYVYIKEIYNWDMEATYLVKNEFNDVYASKVEMNAAITTKANEIDLEVSKKVDGDKMIATLNISPEQIKILAAKILWEGLVTANEYFKILLDGSMEARNGKFSGEVNLEDDGTTNNSKLTITSALGLAKLLSNGLYFTANGITTQILAGNDGTGIYLEDTNNNNKFEVWLSNNLQVLFNFAIAGTSVIYADGDVAVIRTANNWHEISVNNGGCYADGSLIQTASSDKRLKQNIKDTEINALDIIKKIKHRQFSWKKSNKYESIGYIAQELAEISPNLVINNNDNGMYTVNLLNMLATATKSIQELNNKVDVLENKIKELEER